MKQTTKTGNIKKAAAIALTAAVICSVFGGCSGGTKKSNPVAVDESGDVDMEKALSYETNVDELVARLEAKEVDPNKPVSENAGKKTLEVFNYLRENYGKKTLSAQQISNEKGYEDAVYYSHSKDLPAIRGFDMIFVTSSGDTAQVDQAIDWHKNSGGLVTFTWHWNVPKDINNPDGGKAFYTDEISNFSLANAVTPGTAEYEQVIHDIDLIAIQLQRLEEADVPVLWRPLHEASGSWFWWGGVGRGDNPPQESYLKLWYIIFDRLENYHKLTNLIWIWNGQDKYHTVNPNTYDISGTDIYPSGEDHTPQAGAYKTLSGLTAEGKMLALTECGYIPDVSLMQESETMWLYSMLWNSDFVYEPAAAGLPKMGKGGIPLLNTEKMSEEFFEGFLKSDDVITWQKMPQWEGTEKKLPEVTDTMFKLAEMRQ